MSLPEPVPGLVIRYSYLWRAEQARGQEEGVKDRPCAVVLVAIDEDGDRVVTVLPITHAPPADPTLAIELPANTKRRLKLDDDRSWVMLTEANQFVWPGPDLKPINRNQPTNVAFGPLPYALFEEIRRKFIGVLRQRCAYIVPRTE